MDAKIENLISDIGKLRDLTNSKEDVESIRQDLNYVLPIGKCKEVIYTNNVDKLPFGCIVLPTLADINVNAFLITGDEVTIKEYKCEIDSKMFDYGLTDEEITQILLFNIFHLISGTRPCEVIREYIDNFFCDENTQLIIRDSVQYKTILAFGIADALCKITSCLYLPDDIDEDAYLESLDFEYGSFKTAIDKLYSEIPGCENEATRAPNLSMLNWSLRLYSNVNNERPAALHLLRKAKEITASNLYIKRIDAMINSLNRIDTDAYVTEAVNSALNEKGGLLAYLKYTGLRDLENDLYEFQIRAKNAEGEQEVMYALKQINARLTILADYIRENQDDPDIDHWIEVKAEYEELRDILAKKRLHKRSYGIFVDYDALDQLD